MTLDEYSGFVRLSWQGDPDDLTQSARQLCAEAGEILSKFNKLDYKPNSSISTLDLEQEIGDLLYYVVLTSLMTGTLPLLHLALNGLSPLECEDPHTRTETMHRMIDKTNAVMGMSLQYEPNTETIGVYLVEILEKAANLLADYDITIAECMKTNKKKLDSSDFNGWRA